MSGRIKSVYAGKPAYDMQHMIASPETMRAMAKAKTKGYLSSKAKPNRWNIDRVDVNANICLQSSPCQHSAALWLSNRTIVSAPSMNGAHLYALCKLLGVKLDKAGEAHLGEYASRADELRDEVIERLTKFQSNSKPESTKKRSASGNEKSKKARSAANEASE